MRFHITLLVLGLFVLTVAAKPGSRKDKHGKGHGRGHPRQPSGGGTAGDTGDRPSDHGGKNGRGGRPDGQGGRPHGGGGRPHGGGGRPHGAGGSGPPHGGRRPDTGQGGPGPDQGTTDPNCENLRCPKPDQHSSVCGTNGETYRSECYLLNDRCKGRIGTDVAVASKGRCQHPAEAGEPRGHGRPGRPTPGHHRGPGGKTRRGKRPGGRTPKGGRSMWWPEECWELMTTMEPATVPDYVVDGDVTEGPVCTANCPVVTRDGPLQTVCGTNGRTYESPCVLELVACVTDNIELTVSFEGPCK